MGVGVGMGMGWDAWGFERCGLFILDMLLADAISHQGFSSRELSRLRDCKAIHPTTMQLTSPLFFFPPHPPCFVSCRSVCRPVSRVFLDPRNPRFYPPEGPIRLPGYEGRNYGGKSVVGC